MKTKLQLKAPRIELAEQLRNPKYKPGQRKQPSQSRMKSLDQCHETVHNKLTSLTTPENLRKFSEVPPKSFIALNINEGVPTVHVSNQHIIQGGFLPHNMSSARTLNSWRKSSQFDQNKRSFST